MSSNISDNKYLRKYNSYYINSHNISSNKVEKYDKGGISESRLVNNNSNIRAIMDTFKCKICKNILLNPYDCSKCGNTFCFNCINRLKQNKMSCPFNCKSFDITPSSYGLKKLLNQLKFECKYKKKGCKEILPYMNIENHENNCPYNVTTCPNAECKQKIKNNMLANHVENECPFTLFKCKNCGLSLNRKEILLHNKICIQIKEQLNSQCPIINELTKEQNVKNNKEFNSFMNILSELNEDYFYLFDNNKNHNYYYNYSNKGLITLIKCLISLFQYKFGVIETKLNDIYNNIKKVNNEKAHTESKNGSILLEHSNKKNNKNYYSNDFNDIINKNLISKYSLTNPTIESKIININPNKKIDNYNSEDNQKKWETINLENARLKHKIFLNNLYNKEKRLEFFHRRQNSNDFKKRSLELNNINEINNINNYNDNYINNELFFLGDNEQQHKSIGLRHKTDIKQNINFPSFILQKKKSIEQKIMGNKLNKSSTNFYKNYNSLNISNSFNQSNRETRTGFYLPNQKDEKNNSNNNDSNSMNKIKNNIYERKIMNTFSSKTYKEN